MSSMMMEDGGDGAAHTAPSTAEAGTLEVSGLVNVLAGIAVDVAQYNAVMAWDVGDVADLTAAEGVVEGAPMPMLVAAVAELTSLTKAAEGRGCLSAVLPSVWTSLITTVVEPRKALQMVTQAWIMVYAAGGAGSTGTEGEGDTPAASTALASALTAANLYIGMCALPGVHSYGLFDAGVMRRALWTVKRAVDAVAAALAAAEGGDVRAGQRRRAPPGVGRRAVKRSRPSRRRGSGSAGVDAACDEDDEMVDEEEGEEGGQEGVASVAPLSMATVVPAIMACAALTTHCSLQLNPQLLPAVMDVITSALVAPGIDDRVEHLCATILTSLTSPLHGAPLMLTRLACKRLKPLLSDGCLPMSAVSAAFAALEEAEGEAHSSASHSTTSRVSPHHVRTRALRLVLALVTQGAGVEGGGEDEEEVPHRLLRLPAIVALLQHLALGAATARADARRDVVAVITRIRSALPHSLRRAWMRFVLRLSRSTKPAHRLMAVDVAATMLAPPTLADASALMQEGPSPSLLEAGEEAGGYGDEGETYAQGVAALGEGTDGLPTAGSSSQAGGTTPSTAGRVGPRRASSITALMPDMTRTPGATDRTMAATTGRRLAAASPFYRSGMGRASGSAASTLPAGSGNACPDPRPTAWALAELLFHRASDKSPVVRARAVAAVAEVCRLPGDGVAMEEGEGDSGLTTTSSTTLARTVAILLDLIARMHWAVLRRRAAVLSALGGGGDAGIGSEITLSDITLGILASGAPEGEDDEEDEDSQAGGVGVEVAGVGAGAADRVTTIVWTDATRRCHALIPLLCVRMEEEGRPVLKKAAVAALTALGCQALPGWLHAPDIERCSTELDGGSFDGLSGKQARMLRHHMRHALAAVMAKVGETATSPATCATTVGLYGLQLVASMAVDASVLVRKAAAGGMHALFTAQPSSPTLAPLWVSVLLPLLFDSEPTVVAKAVDACHATLVAPIAAAAGGKGKASPVPTTPAWHGAVAAWRLLALCAGNDDLEACIRQAVALLARTLAQPAASGPAPLSLDLPSIVKACTYAIAEAAAGVDATVTLGAWVMLTAIVDAVLAPGKQAALVAAGIKPTVLAAIAPPLFNLACQQWLAMAPGQHPHSTVLSTTSDDVTAMDAVVAGRVDGVEEGDAVSWTAGGQDTAIAVRCLTILHTAAVAMGPTTKHDAILASLTAGLQRLAWNANVLGPALRVVHVLSGGCALPGVAGRMEAVLGHYLRLTSQAQADAGASVVTRALFVLGDIGMLNVDAASGQGVLDAGVGGAKKTTTPPSLITTTQQSLVQCLLTPTFTTPAGGVIHLSDALRAHAYLTLGKLCLGSAPLAAKFTPLFVADLSSSATPVPVRNNILFVLGDLLVKYTGVVDRYMETVTAAVRDPSPLVRNHAINLLTQLVLTEYVKPRASLVHHLSMALVDSNATVRGTAENAVCKVLAGRFRGPFVAHFLPTMFQVTGCGNHTAAAAAVAWDGGEEGMEVGGASPTTDAMAALPGASRLHLYRTLLSTFTDEQRLTVYGKLCNDVLAPFVDGTLSLTDPTITVVLMDALAVLSMKEMRASASVGKVGRGGGAAAGGDAGGEEDGVDGGADGDLEFLGTGGTASASSSALQASMMNAARSRIVGRLARKQIVDTVLPLCLALRGRLQTLRSPLADLVLAYLATLAEDFGADIRDALAADRTLLSELEYDIRVWKQGQAAAGGSSGDADRVMSFPPAMAAPINTLTHAVDVENPVSPSTMAPVAASTVGPLGAGTKKGRAAGKASTQRRPAAVSRDEEDEDGGDEQGGDELAGADAATRPLRVVADNAALRPADGKGMTTRQSKRGASDLKDKADEDGDTAEKAVGGRRGSARIANKGR